MTDSLKENLQEKLQEKPDEKRTQPRKRVLKEGKIIFSHGNFVVDCLIDNLSDSGAHLRIQTSTLLPKEFHLFETARCVAHKVTVVRRTAKGLGVRFDGFVEDPAVRELYTRKWKR